MQYYVIHINLNFYYLNVCVTNGKFRFVKFGVEGEASDAMWTIGHEQHREFEVSHQFT